MDAGVHKEDDGKKASSHCQHRQVPAGESGKIIPSKPNI
jgi:hypothetical protein